MNGITKIIMEQYKVNAAVALKIQAIMDQSGLDYSECAMREFNKAIKEAAAQILK